VAVAGQAHGQHPAHRLDLGVQGQLADHRERRVGGTVQRARGREDAQRDRQIEGRAFLADVGRGEIDGDAVVGEGEAGVADGRPHTLAAFPHRGVGQADGGERR
jgi:hypothetical protein